MPGRCTPGLKIHHICCAHLGVVIYGGVSIEDEFEGAEFGDRRLAERLVGLGKALAAAPASSFPTALDVAGLEGAYRFLNNQRVTPSKILQPHYEASATRAAALGTVIVAHDTTELKYSTPRDGLGRLRTGGNGVFVHVGLALSADGRREPVGVVGLETFVRTGEPKRKTLTKYQRRATITESTRWGNVVDAAHDVLGDGVAAIHVMDREADSYALLAQLVSAGRRFTIRLRQNRRLDDDEATLVGALAGLPDQLCRRVQLSRRVLGPGAAPRTNNGPRDERSAKLVVRGGQLTLRRPDNARKVPSSSLEVGVVHVRELDAPPGSEAVEWILLTSEPVATPAQLEFVVDTYRARWCIEELFKALKTGCAIEKRQLESKDALLNALAVFLPISWELLRLRHLARDDAGAPSTTVLNALQLHLLRADPRAKLRDPSVRAALLAVARLGGHLAQNGDPGWQVLGRGYERLLLLEQGARMALALEGCDQS
jgi:hypothetical protein